MVRCRLRTHRVRPWTSEGRTHTRGWFFFDGRFHEGKETLVFEEIRDFDSFLNKIRTLNGNFAVIHSTEKETFLAVDRIASYPLFYAVNGSTAIVSDDIEMVLEQLGSVPMDVSSQREFIASQMVIGKKTLYRGIYQVRAGECIRITHSNLQIVNADYFLHLHEDSPECDIGELCQELDRVVESVFQRLVESINGKPIVLFLSGGYDSRLVATSLRKVGYGKVICVTFGREGTLEVQVAREVAASLGYPWVLLDYKPNYLMNKLSDPDFRCYLKSACGGRTLPYIQAVILKEYIEKNLIPRDCVVVTGNTGDVLEGKQFLEEIVPGRMYSKDDIISSIRNRHFMMFGASLSLHRDFGPTIAGELNLQDSKAYTYEECQDLAECFNWRERQSKYVVNDIRGCDEYLHVEWRLPLWDNEFIDFWRRVPTALRAGRRLYFEYVKEEKYRSANVETTYSRLRSLLKKNAEIVVALLYPAKKILGYLSRDDQFYAVGTRDFLRILWFTKGYRISVISTQIYMICRDIYGESFGGVFELAFESV